MKSIIIVSILIITIIILKNTYRDFIKWVIYTWFQYDANTNSKDLHKLSGWPVSKKHFNEWIVDGIQKMNSPIKSGDSIFELGVGVGAVLKVISEEIQLSKIGGSDISINAINKSKHRFPKNKQYFNVQNMTDKHTHIPNNYFDHVISFGALGMYLYRDEMVIAIKEAVRMTKPGGSLCFTHFIEPTGKNIGSIIDKVDKSYWINMANELNIDNVKIYPVKHQGDRYMFCCTKKL